MKLYQANYKNKLLKFYIYGDSIFNMKVVYNEEIDFKYLYPINHVTSWIPAYFIEVDINNISTNIKLEIFKNI